MIRKLAIAAFSLGVLMLSACEPPPPPPPPPAPQVQGGPGVAPPYGVGAPHESEHGTVQP